MNYLTSLLLGTIAAGSVQCTQRPAPLVSPHYQVKLDSKLWDNIHTYSRLTRFNKRESVIVLNWTAVYDGVAVYVSSTHHYPSHFQNYPLFWTYADSTLVFVYDNKYPNLLVDSLALKHEIDTVIRTSTVALSRQEYYTEDPFSLRFITAHGQQRIDTSRLYVKMCQ
jgi:hypothetical protein